MALAAQPIARLPLWWDEGGSVAYGRLPVAQLVATIATEDVHPPGYYLLLHGWMQAAGTSPFAIRLLSALCAPVTAGLLFALGRRLLPDSPAGPLAAAGVSLSGFGLHHFSEARMYAPGLLLAAGSFWVAALAGRRWSRGALFVVLVAGAYLHYGFIVIVLAHGLAGTALAVRKRQWREVAVWAAIGLGFTLAYLPWLLVALGGTAGGDTRLGYAALADWLSALVIAATQLAAGPQADLSTLALPGVLLAIGGYAVWRLAFWRAAPDGQRAVVVALALSVLGGIVFASLFNYNPAGVGVASRLGFAAVPGLLLLAALGVALLDGWRRLVTAGSLTALMVSPVLAVIGRQHPPDEDFRPTAAVLDQLARPGDAALLALHWQDGYIESYAPQAPLALVRKLYAAETVEGFLAEVRVDHPRVWVVNYRAPYGDPSDPLYPLLAAQGTLVYREAFGQFELALVDFAAPTGNWRDIPLAGPGTIAAREVARNALPGDSLVLELQLRDVPPDRRVFVHLGLPATPPVAQVDALVAPRLRLGLTIPPSAAAGAYQLFVGLYDPLTGQRDALRSPAGCDEPERACLGAVEVR